MTEEKQIETCLNARLYLSENCNNCCSCLHQHVHALQDASASLVENTQS